MKTEECGTNSNGATFVCRKRITCRQIPLQRPAASVGWFESRPTSSDTLVKHCNDEAQLMAAEACEYLPPAETVAHAPAAAACCIRNNNELVTVVCVRGDGVEAEDGVIRGADG
jgi:hypothetical protein